MFSLENRVAIVTGAGSPRGIGRSIALALAEQGATVVVTDINGEGAANVANEITAAGGRSVSMEVSVTSEEQIAQVVTDVIQKFGKIDILVNNAGVTQPVKVENTTLADWNRIIEINLTGTFLFSKAVLPIMKENKFGRIVNVSSVSAKRGGGVFGGAHYSAAKAGILAFSKALTREVGISGITVNSVTPGLIATDIRGGLESPEKQTEMSREIPVGRIGLPQEVAAAICFLASDEAAYITGEEIDINGGSHMD